jgi:hypothetical protein
MLHLGIKSGMANMTLKNNVQYAIIPILWMYVLPVCKLFILQQQDSFKYTLLQNFLVKALFQLYL